MSKQTRKRIWPVSLVVALAVAGLMAAMALSTSGGVAQAQGLCDTATGAVLQGLIDAGVCPDPSDDGDAGGEEGLCDTATGAVLQGLIDSGVCPDPDGDGQQPAAGDVTVSGWSSSSNGGDTITITVTDGMRRDIDASFILVLEDDFVVPDSIPNGVVYFRQSAGLSGGARTYASVSIDSEDDSDDDDATYNVGDDSHTIQIYVPDMDPADATASGLGTTKYTIVIPKEAGIKNAGDSRDSKIGYQLVNSGGFVEGMTQMFGNDGSGDDKADSKVTTNPKVTLDDKNNKRGYELNISGTGFNKNSSATAYVLKGQDGDAPSCATVIADGESLGSGTVGGDYKVAIVAEVTGGGKGDFSPGETNYICIRDDNSPTRRVSASPKAFELQHSIAVEPSDVASGEEVTVKLRDYPSGFSLESVALDGKKFWTDDDDNTNDDFDVDEDGSELTFDMPGGVSGTVEVAVTGSGASNKDATITVNPSSLDLSQSEVAPNASIIISGSGFNEGKMIAVEDITIDDERLVVDDAGTVTCPTMISDSGECVQVTSSGEFTATVRVWTHSSSNKNPALDDDEFTIKVKDQDGFEGKAKVTIKEATVKVTPETASPRDFIVISGENWPISTAELDNSVTIEIDGRTRQADVDSTGRFRYEYQLRANIGIGDEHDVKATYADGTRDDIEEETTFSVVEADISVTPAAAAPGQTISVAIGGMRPYTLINEIRIGRVSLLGNQSVTTDREGDATVSDITVPYLDPGHYPVTVQVGNDTRVVEFEMLAEAAVSGVAVELPGAVSDLGDNLDAIFHFNNQSKAWTFFDPRPEFADLNTLSELNAGQPYWILVKDSQEDVDWNGRLVNFTCAGGDCWNLEIW